MKARAIAFAALLFAAGCRREDAGTTIRFTLGEDARVFVSIENSEGKIVRELAAGDRLPRGRQTLLWDGLDDGGVPVPPGRYRWRGTTHRGLGIKLRGWACAGPAPSWPAATGKSASDLPVAPSAVAADDERIYLAWTNGQIMACDLDFHRVWSATVGDDRACAALAVDGGGVFALARSIGTAAGDEIVRFSARDGAPAPWPDAARLSILKLWAADSQSNPSRADGLCVRAGRIYLTFTQEQFLAVLDAQSGAYLQTVVGPAPHLIDATPTKAPSPDRPGELMDADFAVVALRGGALGKVLFAHDPLWVMNSDLQPLESDERISALLLLGDGAKAHRHSVFVGLAAPFHQVQRRSVLDTTGFEWIAGRGGGRAAAGPWEPEALGPVRGVALDAKSRLWVAEGDDVPPRFSVWSTDGNQGRLVREIFGPPGDAQSGAAVLPDDPNLFVGAGCEWRLDPATGEARCLGVIAREAIQSAVFTNARDGAPCLLAKMGNGDIRLFERRGDGDYTPRGDASGLGGNFDSPGVPGRAVTPAGILTFDDDQFAWLDGKLRLGRWPSRTAPARDAELMPGKRGGASQTPPDRLRSLTQGADGKIYGAATGGGVWNLQITGTEALRLLPGGTLAVGGRNSKSHSTISARGVILKK